MYFKPFFKQILSNIFQQNNPSHSLSQRETCNTLRKNDKTRSDLSLALRSFGANHSSFPKEPMTHRTAELLAPYPIAPLPYQSCYLLVLTQSGLFPVPCEIKSPTTVCHAKLSAVTHLTAFTCHPTYRTYIDTTKGPKKIARGYLLKNFLRLIR